MLVQIPADDSNAFPARTRKHGEDHPADRRLRIIKGKGPALFVLKFNSFVSVRSGVERPFSFFGCRITSGLHPALDRLIFPAAHKKAKFEVFFVKLIRRVISLLRSNYVSVRILEGPLHRSLVNRVTPGQTFDLHDQNAVPDSGFHLLQKFLHHRTGSDRFS